MNQTALQFPITLQGKWISPSNVELAPNLVNWLIDPTSLTARLVNHCDAFRVELLGQRIDVCSIEEANEDVPAGSDVLVREVLLYCDDVPHVFARSLLPLDSLTGEQKKLAHLGNQSLGQVLFNDPSLVRKCIEISPFARTSRVGELADALLQPVNAPLWGRRSVFMLNNKALMVAEVFLPNALAYHKEVVS